MALNRTIQLEDISAMPQANTAGGVLLTCPRGYRYKNITLKLKNSANTTFNTSSVPLAEVRGGGGIQRRVSLTRMDAINALNGVEYASQAYGVSGTDYERHIKFYFEEPWRTRIRKDSVDPNTLGWKTGWMPANKPLQIALQVAALGAGVAAMITAEAEVSDDDDGKENAIIKWNQDEANANSTTVNVTNLDNGLKPGEGIVQISAFNTTDGTPRVPSVIRLEAGTTVIRQDQTIRALTTELIGAGMAPATANAIANAAHLVFDKNDALDDALAVGFNSSLLKISLDAASSAVMPYVTQILGLPNKS